ncbi:MAG: 50S ribosomal protein L29 [Candidatus Moranbacteria bacterium]|nr:50S ribosomal protein L29 [Candidatus Moranbacteria bacterium]
MDPKELRQNSLERLRELARAEKAKIVDYRIKYGGKSEVEGNVRGFRKAKKNLAQILTIISQKQRDGKK